MTDFNLDNRDDVVLTPSDGVAVLDGNDGSSLEEMWSQGLFGSQEFLNATIPFPDPWGLPRLAGFSSTAGVTVFREGLKIDWSVGSGVAANSTAVLADVDGDTTREMVLVGDDGGSTIVAYDMNGNRRWTYDTHVSQLMAASADVDNDGRDEILYVRDTQLVAVGDDGGGPFEKWTWTAPDGAYLGPMALGDVDEDGDLEIVLFGGRTLWVLGADGASPAPATPQLKLAAENFEAGSLRFDWDHSAFATHYRLLVATDPAMSNLIEARSLPRTRSDLILSLAQGEYWVQVEASNPQGLSVSAVKRIMVGEMQNTLDGIFGDGFE